MDTAIQCDKLRHLGLLRSRTVSAQCGNIYIMEGTCLHSVTLAAAEAAAQSTDCPIYLLSRQTTIPSVELQRFVFRLLLTVLFG